MLCVGRYLCEARNNLLEATDKLVKQILEGDGSLCGVCEDIRHQHKSTTRLDCETDAVSTNY